jgi:hypothetical protein
MLKSLAHDVKSVGYARSVSLYLSNAVDDSTWPTLELEVYKLRKSDKKIQDDALLLKSNSPTDENRLYNSRIRSNQKVHLFELDMDEDPNIGISSFLDYAAREVEALQSLNVYDVILHGRIDEFGTYGYLMRIYYEPK